MRFVSVRVALLASCCCVLASSFRVGEPLARTGRVGNPTTKLSDDDHSRYSVGVGKADITGPAADVNMMGYAHPTQITAGIHIRQYARAYVFDDGAKRALFVNLDACMASQAILDKVLERLREKYGDVYTAENVAISGVHTHSGPGGFLEYLLYGITSLGFVKQTYWAIVDGIGRAVDRAHNDLAPAALALARSPLLGASVNRSPTAYEKNPADERALYEHDTDKDATALVIRGRDGRLRGAIQWFAVHGTSLNSSNTLISGDNKGLAAQLFEREAAADGGDGAQSGAEGGYDGDVVAAFAQSNVGDVSPNTQGAFCGASDERCQEDSTCAGRSEDCCGRGPAWPDDFASNAVIARLQAEHLRDAVADDDAQTPVAGPIDFRHTYLDMTGIEVAESRFTRAGRTCPAAMGFSFAAGTTDGPGDFDFRQNDTHGNAFWRVVRRFIKAPSEEAKACHAPKPILLSTGEMTQPYAWQPAIVPISLLRVGSLLIACVPAEMTTMAGRRLRAVLQDALRDDSSSEGDLTVVIAGLCNGYSSYVATFEEYQIQRYEGASTIYGPHTLDAYLQEYGKLAAAMAAGDPVPGGLPPPDLKSRQISLLPGVVIDAAPWGSTLGGIVKGCDAEHIYRVGDTVKVSFHAGCPRNDVRLEGTFMTVQQRSETGDWVTRFTDAHWETKFHWTRVLEFSPFSFATLEWRIQPGTPPGQYRLQYLGDAKKWFGARPVPIEGVSGVFEVEEAPGSAVGTAHDTAHRHDKALRRAVAALREARTRPSGQRRRS